MDPANKPGDPPPAGDAGKKTDANHRARTPFMRRPPVIVVGTLMLAGLLFLALHYLAESFTHESTDDAFLDGDVVSVAPKVSGRVATVHVVNNQSVNAGDLLVDIDPRDYEIEVAQKKSALAAADANVKVIKASFELLEEIG